MKLYLAGPMRGIPQYNFPAFDNAAAALRHLGHEVVSPADHDREVEPDIESTERYRLGVGDRDDDTGFQALMGWDLAQVATPVALGGVEGIALLPGWENSTGAAHELYVAKAAGKRIFYVQEWIEGALVEYAEPVVIGLSGYAQTGKDTLGSILVGQHGFERIAFADKLREFLLALDPTVLIQQRAAAYHPRLSTLIQAFGWEQAKTQFPEVRELLQRLGTEAGRRILGENVWINAALGGLQTGHKYVITDVRFLNEFHAVKSLGGQVWRLERPGFVPVNAHESETALNGVTFDQYIFNCMTIKDLAEHAALILAH